MTASDPPRAEDDLHTSTDIDLDQDRGNASTTFSVPEVDASDDDLDLLQEILIGSYRRNADDLEQEVVALQTEVDELNRTINDKQALIDTLSPIVASSIHQSIIDSREEMTEALYPILGQLVTRAVSESMRDLVHRIDTQMRRTFSFGVFTRRLKARLLGITDAELALREALPFQVSDLFLIHRESGILLQHLGADSESHTDSDLISGMLTAIRDFVGDAFGQASDADSDLDQIQYGDTMILVEEAQNIYLAAVTTGFAPQDFRTDMRQLVYSLDLQFGPVLDDFDGDVSSFDEAQPLLATLMPAPVSSPNKVLVTDDTHRSVYSNTRLIIGIVAIIAGIMIIGWLLWQLFFAEAFGANAGNNVLPATAMTTQCFSLLTAA